MKHEAEHIQEKQTPLESTGDFGNAASSEANALGSSNSVRSPKSLQLDNAYQEYHKRLENGEQIDPDEYCARYPHLQSSLGRLLQLHSFLADHDDLVATYEYPQVGSTFLHFTLLHELGEGAFAKVFLADDTVLGRRAVLKLSRRAKAEAKIMGPIEHRNIVLVHSIAESPESGLTAICMPYRGSATLEDVLVEVEMPGGMPAAARVILEVARCLPMPLDAGSSAEAPSPILQQGTYVDGVRVLGAEIADALAYLHAHGICHGDLKPSNILLTPNGTPMLLDFNLSTTFQAEPAPFGGTLPYMAPEALSAVGAEEPIALTGPAGAKADVYSFGVILYQLATGTHPLGRISLKWTTPELRDHLLTRQKAGVTPACALNPQVDRPLSDLIQRCLALDPLHRPESAAAIAAELKPASLETAKPKATDWRRLVAFAGVLFCILAIGVASLVNSNRQPTFAESLQAAQENYRQGNYAETIRQCRDLIVADPTSTQAFYLSARANTKFAPVGGVKFFESALIEYRTLDEKASNGRYLAGMGYCFNGRGDHKSAIALYRAALGSPVPYENAEVHNNIGFSLMRNAIFDEDWRVATQSIDRAIQLKPELAIPYYNRGIIARNEAVRFQGGNTSKGKAAEPKSAKLAPSDYLDRKIAQGILDYKTAIEKGEDSAGIYFDVALLHAMAAKTDPQRAKDALQYLRWSCERGQNPQSLNNNAFNTIREDIMEAKLDRVIVRFHKSAPTVRFLDPLFD